MPTQAVTPGGLARFAPAFKPGMKKYLTLFAGLFVSFSLWAQAPAGAAKELPPINPRFLPVWHKIEAGVPGVGPIANQDAFKRFWEAKLIEFEKNQVADQGAVVFLGDSITRLWDLKSAFPQIKTANHGISGDTTRGMLFRACEFVVDLKPRLIVYHAGINDLSNGPQRGGTPETIAANVRAMLRLFQEKLPQTPVIVCETMPGKARGSDLANAAVDKILGEFPNAHRLRMYRLFLGPDGKINSALFKDNTHPNAAGYAVWQSALEPLLNELLGRDLKGRGNPPNHP